jgi:ATP-dependent DNA ligase
MPRVAKRSASQAVKAGSSRRSRPNSPLPLFVPPQLSQPVDKPPSGPQWVHVPPPRSTRFGSPLVLSRVHWVEPRLVAEITYLTWTADNLLRHTVYVGLREDKPADQVRREVAAPARS